MPTNITTHTFTKGMITDTGINLKNNESYDYAENLRLTNDSVDTLGALTNMKGFESFTATTALGAAFVIVNTCTIRDKVYMLCTTRSGSGTDDAIYRMTVNPTAKTLTALTLLYQGELGLHYTKSTDVVGIYEASDNIKLYFSTKGENLKVVNVSTYLTSDGLVKSGGNTWIDSSRFDMLTRSSLSNLSFDSFTSGTLQTGRVQYAYNLYKEKLQESVISPLSNMVSLYSDSEGEPSSKIKGDYETANSNKGIALSLTLSQDDVDYYDYIRVYRIHYIEYDQIPQIVIIGDFSISSSTNYNIIDYGQSGLGELTNEEFTILTEVYSVKTIDVKDNRLFAGNIIEDVFDVDYDARAYRFRNTYPLGVSGIVQNVGTPSFFYEINFSSYINLSVNDVIRVTFNSPIDTQNITVTTVVTPGSVYRFSMLEYGGTSDGEGVITVQDTSQTICNLYEHYGNYTTPQHTILASTLGYPNTTTELDYNSINPYNDINNDYNSDYGYMYQANGTTVGGSGPNISYSFGSRITIGTGRIKLDDIGTIARTYYSSIDYTNNLNIQNTVGYQRGEIYRIGVVFRNDLGQESKVKWIGDIRIPVYLTNPLDYITYSSVNRVYAYPIGINFTLANLPSSVASWEIVRVKRTKTDRSIVTSGYLSRTVSYGAGTTVSPIPWYNTSLITNWLGESVNDYITSFVSPEEIFQGHSDIKISDYVDIVGGFSDYATYTYSGNAYPDLFDNRKSCIKYHECEIFDDQYYGDRFTLKSFKFIPHAIFPDSGIEGSDSYFFDSATNDKVYANVYWSAYISSVQSASANDNGRKNILEFNEVISETNFRTYFTSNYSIPYAYIKRTNYGKYLGYSYTSRETNEYISCGRIIPSNDTTDLVFGGDTYICYFDYLTTILNENHGSGNDQISVSVIYPVESVLNLSLRSDLTLSGEEYLNPASFKMQEKAGVHGTGTLYTQETDLYLYNPIYSQEQNINYNFALNNLDLINTFDSRIIYSDKKIYNEKIDSWVKFRANNFIDVDSKYGQIEVIRNFNNDIYFLQEDAFGITPVNERSLLNDNNPGSLSLGVADVLTRYAYINKDYGCKDLLSVLNTNSALYWVDRNRKTLVRFDGQQLVDLSKSKGVKILTKQLVELNSNPTFSGEYLSIYNKDYNEVLVKLTTDKSLVFNEFFDVFSGVMTSQSDFMFSTKGLVCTEFGDNIYGHDKTHNYNEFISGSALTHMNSILRFTNSDNLPSTKVYDNLAFFTYSKNSTGWIINNDTFYSASFKNDYQYSISTDNTSPTPLQKLTLNDNLKRKERGYSIYIPRNIVNANGTTNIDITNALNQISSREYKERMRDKYLQTELVYHNSDYLFVVPEVQLTYRYSKPNLNQ
jgi:hypothetical protein